MAGGEAIELVGGHVVMEKMRTMVSGFIGLPLPASISPCASNITILPVCNVDLRLQPYGVDRCACGCAEIVRLKPDLLGHLRPGVGWCGM